jgi:hypothetical protein
MINYPSPINLEKILEHSIMATKKNWIQGAIKKPGAFTAQAKKAKMPVAKFASKVTNNPDKFSTTTVKRANLAKTLMKMSKKK